MPAVVTCVTLTVDDPTPATKVPTSAESIAVTATVLLPTMVEPPMTTSPRVTVKTLMPDRAAALTAAVPVEFRLRLTFSTLVMLGVGAAL